MDTVCHITEILEMILLELPVKDLLVNAQRVNKSFHAIVTNSPRLQQSLFFKPLPDKPLRLSAPENAAHRTISRNPFFDLVTRSPHRQGNKCALARSGASWRRMLVTQPPIVVLHRPRIYWVEPWNTPDIEVVQYDESADLPLIQNDNADIGLTFGAIDSRSPLEYRIGSDGQRVIKIIGEHRWKEVRAASDVERIGSPRKG